MAEPGKPVSIREVITGFLAMKPQTTIEGPIVVKCGDTALMHYHWALKGTGPDGGLVEMDMRGTEIVRKRAGAS